ncbi:hypothetical protein [Marinospirillum sp.]
MSASSETFQDSASILWFPIGLVVLLAMPLLPAAIGWAKVLF